MRLGTVVPARPGVERPSSTWVCGTGVFATAVAELGIATVGVDPSACWVHRATER
jgi:hypothetical protein